MPVGPSAELRAVTPGDVPAVAEFLHVHLNSRVSARSWESAIIPPWPVAAPNHGFFLLADGEVVGVYLAFYSVRVIDGRIESICNLGAWCVLEAYRSHSVRLLRALLKQPGFHFTDLSPSGNVVPLNTSLKFTLLDTATALVPNLPWPVKARRARVAWRREEIEKTLSGADLKIYLDHRQAAGAYHLVVISGGESCYVVFRRDRRKGLPLFASLVYVGNPALFRTTAQHVFRHLLLRRRIPITLVELRVSGARPRLSVMLKSPRPKMYRSDRLRPDQVDYLYSELTCVAW